MDELEKHRRTRSKRLLALQFAVASIAHTEGVVCELHAGDACTVGLECSRSPL